MSFNIPHMKSHTLAYLQPSLSFVPILKSCFSFPWIVLCQAKLSLPRSLHTMECFIPPLAASPQKWKWIIDFTFFTHKLLIPILQLFQAYIKYVALLGILITWFIHHFMRVLFFLVNFLASLTIYMLRASYRQDLCTFLI